MFRHYTTIALVMCLTSACTTTPSTGGSVTASHDAQSECREAINDVTRYCEGKSLNRRRCDSAKEASRKACI